MIQIDSSVLIPLAQFDNYQLMKKGKLTRRSAAQASESRLLCQSSDLLNSTGEKIYHQPESNKTIETQIKESISSEFDKQTKEELAIQKAKVVRGPKIKINGTFEDLVEGSTIFADKSLLIKEIFEDQSQVIRIIMPRRSGKTTNLDMIRTFVQIRLDKNRKVIEGQQRNKQRYYKMFAGGKYESEDMCKTYNELAISKATIFNKDIQKQTGLMDEQGRYPVIFLDLSKWQGANYEIIKQNIKLAIRQLYWSHGYLRYADQDQKDVGKLELKKWIKDEYLKYEEKIGDQESYLVPSIKKLCQLLHKYFCKKVWIFIDQFDIPTNQGFCEFGHEQFIDQKFIQDGDFIKSTKLIKRIIKETLTKNDYVEKAIITGVLDQLKHGILADTQNIQLYDSRHLRYGKYYGLNTQEMDLILKHFEIQKESVPLCNGYKFGDQLGVYNIWSVVNYLADRKSCRVKEQWTHTEGLRLERFTTLNQKTKFYFELLAMKMHIKACISTKIQYSDLISGCIDTVLTFLLWTGYLTPHKESATKKYYILKVPNALIEKQISEQVKQEDKRFNSLSWQLVFKNLLALQEKEFEHDLQQFFEKIKDLGFDRKSDYENVIHTMMAFLSKTDYKVDIYGDFGHYDSGFLDKSTKILYQFKFKHVETKEQQIVPEENKDKDNLNLQRQQLLERIKSQIENSKKIPKGSKKKQEKSNINQINQLALEAFSEIFEYKNIEQLDGEQVKKHVTIIVVFKKNIPYVYMYDPDKEYIQPEVIPEKPTEVQKSEQLRFLKEVQDFFRNGKQMSLTVNGLKQYLVVRGYSKSGNKEGLIKRIKQLLQ